MDVIERWTLTAWRCPECGSVERTFDTECVYECRAEKIEERVEVVPASQFAGAVEEITAIADGLARSVRLGPLSPGEEDQHQAIKDLRRIARELGGQ